MHLEELRTFVDVVKQGSFAAVARMHAVDPSTVSRAIAGLEKELGFRLFQRSTRRLSPTEAGRAYFTRIEGLVEEFDRAGAQALDLVSEPKGMLRLTACTSFGQYVLAPLLPTLRARHPQLTLELVLVDHQIDLISEEIDLAVRFGTRPQGDVIAARLAPRRFKVCASPGYLDAHGPPEHPSWLSDRDCLRFAMPGYRDAWRFRQSEDKAFSVPVSGTMLLTHGVTMVSCARDGLGPALLPEWLCRDAIARGELVDLFPDYDVAANEFDTSSWLVYPSRAYTPLKLRAVIDFLKEHAARRA